MMSGSVHSRRPHPASTGDHLAVRRTPSDRRSDLGQPGRASDEHHCWPEPLTPGSAHDHRFGAFAARSVRSCTQPAIMLLRRPARGMAAAERRAPGGHHCWPEPAHRPTAAAISASTSPGRAARSGPDDAQHRPPRPGQRGRGLVHRRRPAGRPGSPPGRPGRSRRPHPRPHSDPSPRHRSPAAPAAHSRLPQQPDEQPDGGRSSTGRRLRRAAADQQSTGCAGRPRAGPGRARDPAAGRPPYRARRRCRARPAGARPAGRRAARCDRRPPSERRRSTSPRRARGGRRGTATVIVAGGRSSSPCHHAAVAPISTAPSPAHSSAARIRTSTSAGRPVAR